MTDFIRFEHRSLPGGPAGPGRGPGLLTRLLGMLAGLLVLTAAFVASAVLLVVLLTLGALGLGWFWWKTRALRQALREQRIDPSSAGDRSEPRPWRDTTDLRRPHRTDDVSDAQILREEPLEDRVPRR